MGFVLLCKGMLRTKIDGDTEGLIDQLRCVIPHLHAGTELHRTKQGVQNDDWNTHSQTDLNTGLHSRHDYNQRRVPQLKDSAQAVENHEVALQSPEIL